MVSVFLRLGHASHSLGNNHEGTPLTHGERFLDCLFVRVRAGASASHRISGPVKFGNGVM